MAKLFVCGDIVNQDHKEGFLSDSISRIIQDADYSVCNFEGPELLPGEKASYPHQCNGTAAYLNSVGFNLMLLANNHITEQGADGIKNSIDAIKEAGSDYIGAGLTWDEAYKPLIRDIAGIQFGFINVCEAQVGQYISPNQSYGYAWMGYDNLYNDVERLSKKVDYVVVFVHTGLEHYSIPLPEIRDMYKKLCKAGASAVIGCHPHCAQGWERYGYSVIVYSLGNFFFPLRERWPEEAHSYSVVLDFEKQKEIGLIPIFHSNIGNIVEKEEGSIININNLNEMLGDNYEKEMKEMIRHAYSNLCKRLLLEATCGQNETDGWKSIVHKNINYTIRRKKLVLSTEKHREALLLRLFENETYRWIIMRYLKNKEL